MSICLQAEYSTRTIPSIPKTLCCVIAGFLPFDPPFKHQQEQVILIAVATGLRSDTHSGQRSEVECRQPIGTYLLERKRTGRL